MYQSGTIPGFPEVSLYSVRADITDILNQNGGSIGGRYKVRDFAADIFNNQSKHTVANASFSIVLIFQERRLPPRTIVIFDGMQEVLGSTVTALSGFTVSEVPSGSMTIYALEGDCNPGPGDCVAITCQARNESECLPTRQRMTQLCCATNRSQSRPDNPPMKVILKTIF